MSDRENSPVRSESYHEHDAGMNDHKVMELSPPRVQQSRSPSPLPRHEARRHSLSRSRSPASKRKMTSSFRGAERERGRSYRSRTRSRSPRRPQKMSRSRSRSRRRDGRSHSRSPMSNRRRHLGNRDSPNESRCLGVFGLSIYTTERELHDVFIKYGPIDKVQVVVDAKTGRSRGFAFVYYSSKEDARAAKDRCSGMDIDGRRIRVDFSITQRAHTPTPGIYMGKPTDDQRDQRGGRSPDRHSSGRRHRSDGFDSYGERHRERDRYHRSPSPHYSRSRRGGRYERSRSRSYSRRY